VSTTHESGEIWKRAEIVSGGYLYTCELGIAVLKCHCGFINI